MKKYDSLIKKIEVFEKLATYGDRKTFLQALAQTSEEEKQFYNLDEFGNPKFNHGVIPPVDPLVGGYSSNPDIVPVGTPVSSQGPVPVKPKPKPVGGFPAISTKVQQAINTINQNVKVFSLPVKVDGLRDPDTNLAIKAFKNTFMKDSPDATDAQVLNKILETANLALMDKNNPQAQNNGLKF